MNDFLRLAASPPVVRRALGFMLVVGGVLVGINYGDAALGERALGLRDYLKMGLTVCVPYVVSTLSSVAALREHGVRAGTD